MLAGKPKILGQGVTGAIEGVTGADEGAAGTSQGRGTIRAGQDF